MCANDVLRWLAGARGVIVRLDAIVYSVDHLCERGFVSRTREPNGAMRYDITDAGRNHLAAT